MAASNDGSGLRTVTPPSDEHDDSQMNAIGWIIFGLLGLLLLPLLPIAVLVWLYSKLHELRSVPTSSKSVPDPASFAFS